jgi:DNA invertase Pin-like site-specific DNA recombinase
MVVSKQMNISIDTKGKTATMKNSRIYGYCRVSTMRQNIERQIRNVKELYPDAVIVTDEFTGTRLDRPGWQKLYKQLREGDTVVFDQVSRMSRDADEGFRVYEELFQKGVNLIFIKEPHINTETYKKAMETGVPMTGTNVDYILEGVNRYLMSLAKEQIRLAFDQAEKEVEDLRQRTREGIETARLNGKQIGAVPGKKLTTKKSLEAKEVIRKHSKDFGGSLNDVELMQMTGLARNTYYKYKKELREQG